MQTLLVGEEARDDRAILKEFAKTREPKGLNDLIERYRRMVYGLCLREVYEPSDAAEATRATFILLARSASKLKDKCPAQWLLHAIRHVGANAQREIFKRDRNQTADLGASEETALPPPLLNEEDALALAYFQHLRRDDALVLALKYFNGMSARDISKAMDLPEESVLERANLALDNYAQLLRREGADHTREQLDRMLTSQFPWEPPTISLTGKETHRWATALPPSTAQTLRRIGVSMGCGIFFFFFLLPPLVLMAAHQAPANLTGLLGTWRAMATAIRGGNPPMQLAGRWSDEGSANPAGKNLTVMRSVDGDQILFLLGDQSSIQGGDQTVQWQVERRMGSWNLGGRPADSAGDQNFTWSNGDWTLTLDTDRSTERLTVQAQGSKLRITDEKGGSLRSLKVINEFEGRAVEIGLQPLKGP